MTTNRDSVGEIHAYNIDVKNREIYINEFDDSGETGGVDHRMLQNFIKKYKYIKKLKQRGDYHTYANGGWLLVLRDGNL